MLATHEQAADASTATVRAYLRGTLLPAQQDHRVPAEKTRYPPADTMIKRGQGQGHDQGHRVREAGSLGANPDTLILCQLASGPIDLIETRLLPKPSRTPGMRAHDVEPFADRLRFRRLGR